MQSETQSGRSSWKRAQLPHLMREAISMQSETQSGRSSWKSAQLPHLMREAIIMQSETQSVCPHYAISMPSVRHQYASPVEVRLVHAHRDGRQLPGRRRKPIVTVGEPASSDCAEAGKLQMTLLCKGEHAILRPQVDERVLDLDEWQSVAISGTQWHSVAISGTQWHSVALSGTQ